MASAAAARLVYYLRFGVRFGVGIADDGFEAADGRLRIALSGSTIKELSGNPNALLHSGPSSKSW